MSIKANTGRPSAKPGSVFLTVDGVAVEAFEGEALIAALTAAGVSPLRSSPRLDWPRGAFCLMGACQECRVIVDGQVVLACQEPARAGMIVEIGARL